MELVGQGHPGPDHLEWKYGQMGEDDAEIEIFNPPDTLKAKVGTGGPGAVDIETLERAEAVIANLADDYIGWVGNDLVKIDGVLEELSVAKENRKPILDRIFQIAHDIKGQGGSFGYDIMTVVGDQLCRFVENLEDAGPGEIEAISLHINAMKMVIAKRLKGDGGKEGDQLIKGLTLVIDKVTRK